MNFLLEKLTQSYSNHINGQTENFKRILSSNYTSNVSHILNKKSLIRTTSGVFSLFLAHQIIKGSKKVSYSDSQSDLNYGQNEISQLEDRLNIEKQSKVDDLDLPFEMMEDESMAELHALLENPELDPEAYQELMSSQISNQPPPFNRFNQSFKNPLEDESWSGVRLSGEWSPVQSFKLDVQHTNDLKSRSTKYNFMSINPSKDDPSKGIVMVGRYDPSSILAMQLHANASQVDRFAIVANYPKNDQKQGMYEIEYNRTFDRLNASAKISNMGSSASLSVNAKKNLHFGIETHMNVKIL